MTSYIILLDENKLSGVGSDMAQVCHYKSPYSRTQQAERMLQATKKSKYAYFVSDYTQKMCEMDKAEFSAHVQKVGKLLSINPNHI